MSIRAIRGSISVFGFTQPIKGMAAVLIAWMLAGTGQLQGQTSQDSYKVKLGCNASVSPDVTGYRIHYGAARGTRASACSVTVAAMLPGKWDTTSGAAPKRSHGKRKTPRNLRETLCPPGCASPRCRLVSLSTEMDSPKTARESRSRIGESLRNLREPPISSRESPDESRDSPDEMRDSPDESRDSLDRARACKFL